MLLILILVITSIASQPAHSMALTEQTVRRSQDEHDPWRIGNQVLYDLCRRCPRHVDDAEIVAKVWLIGRAYAASIERGRKAAGSDSDLSNDIFYTEIVTKALRNSRLDDKIKALAQLKEVNEFNVGSVLEAHGYLVQLFKQLTGKDKRSLASKYLHFHLPDLFFIYDSRAMWGIRSLGLPRRSLPMDVAADPEYTRFLGAALGLREHVVSHFGVALSPRQLDRLLLAAFGLRSDLAAVNTRVSLEEQ